MKLVELGMLGGMRNYKLCFIADRTSMFPVSLLRRSTL
jgi:ubiquitin-like domain-containing CTD phosphatase 1